MMILIFLSCSCQTFSDREFSFNSDLGGSFSDDAKKQKNKRPQKGGAAPRSKRRKKEDEERYSAAFSCTEPVTTDLKQVSRTPPTFPSLTASAKP